MLLSVASFCPTYCIFLIFLVISIIIIRCLSITPKLMSWRLISYTPGNKINKAIDKKMFTGGNIFRSKSIFSLFFAFFCIISLSWYLWNTTRHVKENSRLLSPPKDVKKDRSSILNQIITVFLISTASFTISFSWIFNFIHPRNVNDDYIFNA